LIRPKPICTTKVANTAGKASRMAAASTQPTLLASVLSDSTSIPLPTGQALKLVYTTWISTRWPSTAKNTMAPSR
jgi:hypothetical protein